MKININIRLMMIMDYEDDDDDDENDDDDDDDDYNEYLTVVAWFDQEDNGWRNLLGGTSGSQSKDFHSNFFFFFSKISKAALMLPPMNSPWVVSTATI